MTDQKFGASSDAVPSTPPPGYTPGAFGGQPTYNQYSNIPTQTQYLQSSPHQPGATYMYRSRPAFITCQHCGSNVTTTLSHSVGTFTWLASGFVCLVGGVAGCCLIPFCMDMCKDAEHHCPNCGKTVGVFKQIS